MQSPSPSRAQSSLLAQYFAFLKSPDDQCLSLGVKASLAQIWRLYTLHLLLIIPMALGIQALSQWIVSVGENKIGTVLETMPPYQFIFLAVVFAPVSEELMFRLPLRFSRLNWGLPLLILSFGLSAIAGRFVPNQMLSFTLVLLMLGVGLLATTLFVDRFSQRGQLFFSRHLRWFVYGSSIIFGLVHITNYPKQAWIVAPFLVLPQTTLGFFLAYVRIRLGFGWAVFTHALHNFVVSSPIIFMALGSDQLRKQLLEQDVDAVLLPRDQLLGLILAGWILALMICILVTATTVVKEWKRERVLSSAAE